MSVSRDPAFVELAGDGGTTGTDITVPALKPGSYRWRVSSLDGDGLEGPPGPVRSFTVLDRTFSSMTPPPPGGTRLAARFKEIGAGNRFCVGGYLRHPAPETVDIVVYSLVDGWYAQWYPYGKAGPPVRLDEDGYWEMGTRGGSRFVAYLVRKGYAGMPSFLARGAGPPKPDGKDVLLAVEAVRQ